MKYNSFDDSMTFESSIRLSEIDLHVYLYCFMVLSGFYVTDDCFMLESKKVLLKIFRVK